MYNSNVKHADIIKRKTDKKVPCTKLPIHVFTHHLKTNDGSEDAASDQLVRYTMREEKMLCPNPALSKSCS